MQIVKSAALRFPQGFILDRVAEIRNADAGALPAAPFADGVVPGKDDLSGAERAAAGGGAVNAVALHRHGDLAELGEVLFEQSAELFTDGFGMKAAARLGTEGFEIAAAVALVGKEEPLAQLLDERIEKQRKADRHDAEDSGAVTCRCAADAVEKAQHRTGKLQTDDGEDRRGDDAVAAAGESKRQREEAFGIQRVEKTEGIDHAGGDVQRNALEARQHDDDLTGEHDERAEEERDKLLAGNGAGMVAADGVKKRDDRHKRHKEVHDDRTHRRLIHKDQSAVFRHGIRRREEPSGKRIDRQKSHGQAQKDRVQQGKPLARENAHEADERKAAQPYAGERHVVPERDARPSRE